MLINLGGGMSFQLLTRSWHFRGCILEETSSEDFWLSSNKEDLPYLSRYRNAFPEEAEDMNSI